MSSLAPNRQLSPYRAIPRSVADEVVERLFPKPNPYVADPIGWCRDRLGHYLWSKQAAMLEAVRDHRHTAIQSAHDTGKSFAMSVLAAWWLDVHPVGTAFVVTTAPTWPQVKTILWREIGRRRREGKLRGRVNLNAEWVMKIDDDEEIVAYGRKPADYDQAAFQGIHADYILVIIDEGGGVPKSLYDAAEAIATNEHARIVSVGNPDDPASHFAKVCAPGSGWHVERISAFDTPAFTGEEVPEDLLPRLVSPIWVEERKKRWGVQSPIYISKVEGRFPDVSDETLIAPDLILQAQLRELPGLGTGQRGLDVARFGADETACYRNRDGVIRHEFSHHKKSTMETAGVAGNLQESNRQQVPMLVDVIGIGSGVYDRMKELEHNVIPFNSSEAPLIPHQPGQPKFINRRAEAYWTLRLMFENGEIDLDPADEDLAAQLGSLRWWTDSRGYIHIESKDEWRKRMGPEANSPDRADAVMMSVAPYHIFPPESPDVPVSQGLTGDLLTRPL